MTRPRPSQNFTAALDHATVARVRKLLSSFGGSVGGFAASLVIDFSLLTPNEIRAIREEIKKLIESRAGPNPTISAPIVQTPALFTEERPATRRQRVKA